MDKGDIAVRKIFELFDKWGGENYIGENVTQLQHAQQVSTWSLVTLGTWSPPDITWSTKNQENQI